MQNWREYKQLFNQKLSSYWGENEAASIFTLCYEEISGNNRAKYLLEAEESLDTIAQQRIQAILGRLEKKEPIQFILNKANFYGLELNLDSKVLVPRPETEELVEWILESYANDKNTSCLDIGTGSGCIALALKKNRPSWEVEAWDIDLDAVQVASKNATRNQIDVSFKRQDITSAEPAKRKIIVSNPPYIPVEESKMLDAHVLDYEPHKALFSLNNDPLYFYRIISNYASKSLESNGALFLECHYQFAREVKNLLQDSGFSEVNLKLDMFGKERMISAKI